LYAPDRMRAHGKQGRLAGIVVLLAALTATVALSASSPAKADAAASPILEFVTPNSTFPVNFTAAGGEVTAALTNFDTVVHCATSAGSGQITGPRSTRSSYVFEGCETQGGSKGGHECRSEGAEPEEIRSGEIEADLVFIDQSTRTVGVLLAPNGGVYLSFECGGEAVKAIGPFLAPIGPINQGGVSFTATLSRSGATQVPSQYEGPNGEALPAIPTGERGTEPPAATGVELGFTIHTAVPIQVKAVTKAEVEATERTEKALAEIAERHRQEVAAMEAAEKQRTEDAIASVERAQQEAQEGAARRSRQLSKAMRQCMKVRPGQKRAHCKARAKKKFGMQPVAVASRD
jgi:hypothetical protein